MTKLKAKQDIFFHNSSKIIRGREIITGNNLIKIVSKDEIVEWDTINDTIRDKYGNLYSIDPYILTEESFEIL